MGKIKITVIGKKTKLMDGNVDGICYIAVDPVPGVKKRTYAAWGTSDPDVARALSGYFLQMAQALEKAQGAQ